MKDSVPQVPRYAESGGPPFFKCPSLKDYVCTKPQTAYRKTARHDAHRIKETRTGFPIELSYVMTAFKGIGDNHIRTELLLNGNFNKPGLFLVGISRVKNPKHLYIHPEHWPSHLELQTQRLNCDVVESENFERFIRIVGARDMRHYGFDLLNGVVPAGIDKDLFNSIADQIYYHWVDGYRNSVDICNNISDDPAFSFLNKDTSIIDHVYAFMKSSDEYLITKKVPHLTRKERYFLESVVKNKKQGITNPSIGKMMEDKTHKSKQTNTKTTFINKVHTSKTTRPPSLSATVHEPLKKKHVFTSTVDGSVSNIEPQGLYNVGNSCFINATLQMFRILPCQWSASITSNLLV